MLVDLFNVRVLIGGADQWSVLVDLQGTDLVPDGVAVVDSGAIAIAMFPKGNSLADRRVLLMDSAGEVLDEGLADGHLNNPWIGTDELWLATGSPVFTRFVKVTDSGSLVPYEAQSLVDIIDTPKYELTWSYDRRGDNDPEFNLSTMTIETDGSKAEYQFFGGSAAAGAQIEIGDEQILTLWRAGFDYVIVAVDVTERSVTALKIPRSQSDFTGSFNYFRFHTDHLYLMQTYTDGTRIERYELPTTAG